MANPTNPTVKQLDLDLRNFRTVPQADEVSATKAMISINPEWFWALMDSLLDDGYLPTENIIVLKEGSKFTVKEGNRRVAALKIILGYLDNEEFSLPKHIVEKISAITKEWKDANQIVPTTVYQKKDAALVDRIVKLTHGKAEQAGRDHWTSVSRARYNRDVGKIAEPALDLLEKYLSKGKNLTGQQKERWSGDYPLTVLAEAMNKMFARLNFATKEDLVKKYPSIASRDIVEEVIRAIGVNLITFPLLRDLKNDVLLKYGVPQASASSTSGSKSSGTGSSGTASGTSTSGKNTDTSSSANTTSQSNSGSKAHPISDPRTVKATLKKFSPQGTNRQKVATLKEEAVNLDLNKNPIAFCFILRSMFEISAKAYCADHSIPLKVTKTKRDGSSSTQEKTLLELLKEITNHLTNNKKDTAKVRLLHGAITELGRTEGILSVTSMNNLVHNPAFSITAGDICTLFGNIYPLLEFMN